MPPSPPTTSRARPGDLALGLLLPPAAFPAVWSALESVLSSLHVSDSGITSFVITAALWVVGVLGAAVYALTRAGRPRLGVGLLASGGGVLLLAALFVVFVPNMGR